MKKILVILNSDIFPVHVVNTAIHIAKSSPSLLHAVFTDSLQKETAYDYAFPNDLLITQNRLTGASQAEDTATSIETHMSLFRDMCDHAGVQFEADDAREFTLYELVEQSAFSDLILTDASETVNQQNINNLLTNTCCPVYLVSKHVEKVSNVILTYDGSFSSIHAIKQYALVFPEMKSLPTHLIHITQDDSDEFPREKNIKSWLPVHYSNVEFKILRGNVRTELINFTKSLPDPLVVMGAFGRNVLSQIFHKSLANAVISDGKSALFIAHK